MTKLLLALLTLPLVSVAQTPVAWGGGVGIGNVLEGHLGMQYHRWLLLGRTQYHWWSPASGPGTAWGDDINTGSRQLEMAALGGYSVPLGRSLLYAGAGLSYLRGRELGEARYAVAKSGLLGGFSYHYSYRDYQALGLPVELGVLSRPFLSGGSGGGLRFGAALQADFNPERPLYAGVLTLWLGRFGQAFHHSY